MEEIKDLREYLKEAGGWESRLSDEDVLHFGIWISRAATFPRSKREEIDFKWIKGNTLDAFRGFCTGMKYSESKRPDVQRLVKAVEKLNRCICDLQSDRPGMTRHSPQCSELFKALEKFNGETDEGD